MPMKTVKLAVTAVVIDRANSLFEEGTDDHGKKILLDGQGGRKLSYKSVATSHVEPGEPVTLEADEADALVARFGAFDEAMAAVKAKGLTVTTARR
jgi:hypothetical protein